MGVLKFFWREASISKRSLPWDKTSWITDNVNTSVFEAVSTNSSFFCWFKWNESHTDQLDHFLDSKTGRWIKQSALASVGDFLKKKQAFMKILFRIHGVGNGNLCVLKRSPTDFGAHPNLVTFGVCDLYDVFF